MHLFELARIYLRDGAAPTAGLPEERRVLTLVTGAFRSAAADWGRQENDFYYVKSVLEAVLERMGITGHGYVAVQHPGFHPYQAAAVVLNHRPEAAGKKPVQPEEVLGVDRAGGRGHRRGPSTSSSGPSSSPWTSTAWWRTPRPGAATSPCPAPRR